MKIFEEYLMEQQLLAEAVEIPSELKKCGVTAKIVANALSKANNTKQIDMQSLELEKNDKLNPERFGKYFFSDKYSNHITFIIMTPKRGYKDYVKEKNVPTLFVEVSGVRYVIDKDKLLPISTDYNTELYKTSASNKNVFKGHENDSQLSKTSLKVKEIYTLSYKASTNKEEIIKDWLNDEKTAGLLRKIKALSDKYMQNPEEKSKHSEYAEKRKTMWKLIQQFSDENFSDSKYEIYGAALIDYLWSKWDGLNGFAIGYDGSVPASLTTAISRYGKTGGGFPSKKERQKAMDTYTKGVERFGGNITFGT